MARLGVIGVLCAAVLVLSAAGGSAGVRAGSGEGGVTPVRIVGATFSIAAAKGTRSGRVRIASTGRLAPGATARVTLRAVVRPRRGAPRAITAVALRWQVDHFEPVTALDLLVRVVTSTDPACPAGTRGTVVVVDDDARPARGRTADTVRLRFRGSSCRAFAARIGNARGSRARVEIGLDLEPVR